MPYPLNNVTVNNDNYADAQTCRFQLAVDQAFVAVFNQSVYMQVFRVESGMRANAGQPLSEEFLVPGAYTLNRGYSMGALSFRRVGVPAAGTLAAQVTAR